MNRGDLACELNADPGKRRAVNIHAESRALGQYGFAFGNFQGMVEETIGQFHEWRMDFLDVEIWDCSGHMPRCRICHSETQAKMQRDGNVAGFSHFGYATAFGDAATGDVRLGNV